jgi:hypothetical protein
VFSCVGLQGSNLANLHKKLPLYHSLNGKASSWLHLDGLFLELGYKRIISEDVLWKKSSVAKIKTSIMQ